MALRRSFIDRLRDARTETTSTDVKRYVRDSRRGPVVYYEVRETTNYEGLVPSTVTEYHTRGEPLQCGHMIDRDHAWAATCRARRWWRTCGNEHCSSCTGRCTVCAVTCSTFCCAVVDTSSTEERFICRHCRTIRRFRHCALALLQLLFQPFIGHDHE